MTYESSEPKYVAETLAWCNRMRAERGKRPLKKLPKGKRVDPSSCPCGKATGLSVSYSEIRSQWSPQSIGTSVGGSPPDAVIEFMHAFDMGRLPQYEAKP
jgi:hypothetical protein